MATKKKDSELIFRHRRHSIFFVAFPVIFAFILSACSFFVADKDYILYPVKSGDTLNAIGQRFAVSVADLQAINDISDPRDLRAGSQLKIPDLGQGIKGYTTDRQQAVLTMKGGHISSSSTGSVSKMNLGDSGRYVGHLAFPVAGASIDIGSRFGQRWSSFHEGIDIRGASGTPIYAAHAGQVLYSGSGIRGYGNIIILKTAGLFTVYGHNSKNYVRTGQQVSKGQHIADIGQTGRASGPHLHFETRIVNHQGKYVAVDPSVFFR